jgi:hypothetical protein
MKENNIFNRLYEQEATPPSFMWDRIAQKLDEEEGISTPVVPMVTRPKTNWLKIAFAACFVGMVVTTALWIIEKNKKKDASNEAIVSNQNPAVQKENVPVTTIPSNSETTSDALNKETTNTTALTPQTTTQPITGNTDNIVSNNTKNPAPIQANTPKEKAAPNSNEKELVVSNSTTQKTDINNTTITIKDENGNPIKNISEVKASSSSTVAGPDSRGDKAIASILTKLSLSSDKEEIDNIINESAYWKKQIQIWRNKLIKSGYAPSLINHLDLVELIKLLDEKK